jgi:hypothetical protein
MISSEVQRTLVKSPPELWAELSDPAALARHLGELGEIRIMRIEPEQLVEWEAPNRTGTVQIKPSGWGTKVTLTVATDVPEAATSASPAEPHTFAEEEPVVVSEDEPAAFAEDEPNVLPEDEPNVLPEDEPAAFPEEEALSPAEEPPAAPDERVPSPLGLPLTAAAASSWRADAEPAGAEEEGVGWIAEDAGELGPEADDRDDDGDTHEWLGYDEPEPRRGFFARLLGRWRRPEAVEGDAGEESTDAAASPGTLSEPESEPEPESELSGGESLPLSAAPAIEEPLALEAEADAAREADCAVEAASEASAPEPPSADDVEPVDRAATEPVAGGAPAAPEAASPEPAPAEQGEDIAAELKAAEETEDAEVTAVLTSVLDRLGAAHHRPFSRS